MSYSCWATPRGLHVASVLESDWYSPALTLKWVGIHQFVGYMFCCVLRVVLVFSCEHAVHFTASYERPCVKQRPLYEGANRLVLAIERWKSLKYQLYLHARKFYTKLRVLQSSNKKLWGFFSWSASSSQQVMKVIVLIVRADGAVLCRSWLPSLRHGMHAWDAQNIYAGGWGAENKSKFSPASRTLFNGHATCLCSSF